MEGVDGKMEAGKKEGGEAGKKEGDDEGSSFTATEEAVHTQRLPGCCQIVHRSEM